MQVVMEGNCYKVKSAVKTLLNAPFEPLVQQTKRGQKKPHV